MYILLTSAKTLKMENKKFKAGIKYLIALFLILIIILVIILKIIFNYKASNLNYNQLQRDVLLNTSEGMQTNDRINDFENLCEYLQNNVPSINNYEELYNISYNDIKLYYRELVKKSSSDYEYFAILQGFCNNIPSCHISIRFPDEHYVTESMKSWISKNTSLSNSNLYWNNIIHEECKKYYDKEINYNIFSYCNGKYINVSNSNNTLSNINEATLLSVNGIEIDEFIKIIPLTSKIKYDFICEKPYRDGIIFNDKFGEECTVEYKSKDGTINKCNMHYDIYSLYAITHKDYFKTIDGLNTKDNQSTHNDNTICFLKSDDTIIVQINSFNSDTMTGKIMSNMIAKECKDYNNIIIDIRNNGGGYFNYAHDVLSAFLTDKTVIKDKVYCTKNEYKENGNFINFSYCKEYDLYEQVKSKTIINNLSKDKNLYLLISDNTASSADWFAKNFKDLKLGTIIGSNNTRGEANGEIEINMLDKSGICFYYSGYTCFNTDGTDNSVYGTCPDIYIEPKFQNYLKKQEIKSNDNDPYTCENLLKWDDVLNKALELIKEKSNDK